MTPNKFLPNSWSAIRSEGVTSGMFMTNKHNNVPVMMVIQNFGLNKKHVMQVYVIYRKPPDYFLTSHILLTLTFFLSISPTPKLPTFIHL